MLTLKEHHKALRFLRNFCNRKLFPAVLQGRLDTIVVRNGYFHLQGNPPREKRLVSGWHSHHHTFPWGYRMSEFVGLINQFNLSVNLTDFLARAPKVATANNKAPVWIRSWLKNPSLCWCSFHFLDILRNSESNLLLLNENRVPTSPMGANQVGTWKYMCPWPQGAIGGATREARVFGLGRAAQKADQLTIGRAGLLISWWASSMIQINPKFRWKVLLYLSQYFCYS